MKKIIICLFVIFGLGLFLNNNTYALDDSSYEGNGNGDIVLCAPTNWNMDVPTCSGYKYLSWDFSMTTESTSSAILAFSSSFGNFESVRLNIFNTGYVGLPDLTDSSYVRFYITNKTYYTGTVSFILSENPPADCPDCPDYPEPVIPDCDEPFIVRLFEGSFWNIATACVGIFVSILALFLVFRLIHGLIYGKGV